MQNDQDREKDLDDFWDIESLLPSKKAPVSQMKRMSVETIEIELGAPRTESVPTESAQKIPASPPSGTISTPYTTKHSPVSPVLTYTPHHPLLGEVRIYPWRSNFNFYERFCQVANALFDRHGAPCDPVPFFSYMPQYDQMSRAQLEWYLYWRDCVRKNQYPDTDYSYIFLYLFEIINLTDRVVPIEGQRLMCNIWRQYRKIYPLLNRYLADWICDYSLIHRLPPPVDAVADLLPLMAENSSFKEFYACPSNNETMQESFIYLTFCTNYNYKKSKLYLSGKEQAFAMDKHIPGAISAVIRSLEAQDSAFSQSKMQKATLSRDSFIGALCSGNMKRRIEVDYCSFHRSHELRFLVSDMIKYTENRLRTVFGMKSRLSMYGLPEQVKGALDAYLDAVLPSKKRVIVQERPDYEALYDLPTAEVSPERAQEIEQTSWDMTRQLVEAFEEEPTLATETVAPEPALIIPTTPKTELTQALSAHAELLRAIDRKDDKEQQSICRAMGKMMDAIAEEINTIASDIMGDILIEDDGSGYALIEDYRSEIAPLL